MKIHESLDLLRSTVQQANKMLAASEKTIDVSMQAMMQSATPEQLKTIQVHIAGIKDLVVKAKRGDNVDAEIKTMSKTFNDGR
jgi:hypothetical protein